jgi:hypothetical protein
MSLVISRCAMLVNNQRVINYPRTCFLRCLGPASESVGCKQHYVSFIDDFNKYTWIYLLKYKSWVFQKFKEFQARVGVVNIKGLIPFSPKLALFTRSLSLMLINRMDRLRENIVILCGDRSTSFSSCIHALKILGWSFSCSCISYKSHAQ